MRYPCLLLGAFWAASAWAQDENPYATLHRGDRVQVLFRSGNTISGQLVPNPMSRATKSEASLPGAERPEEVDYTKEPALTIDLGREYPGLNGTMTVSKREIKAVRKLVRLDEESRRQMEKAKESRRRNLEDQNLRNQRNAQQREVEAEKERERTAKEEKDREAAARKAAEDSALKEKLKILEQFPPEAGWGSERLNEITGKILRKQPVTEQERAFRDSFALWSAALSLREETQKGEKK